MAAPNKSPERIAYALRAAQLAVERGWWLFPLRAFTKDEPLEKFSRLEWHDCAELERWITEGRNLAVECGRSRLIVLDVDSGKGGRAPRWLSDDCRRTVAVVTPTRGYHFYFALPAGVDSMSVRNTQNIVGQWLDTRGWNGYVAYVGSYRADKKAAGYYQWVRGHSPDEIEVLLAPERLLDILLSHARRRAELRAAHAAHQPSAGVTRYLDLRRNLLRDLARCPAGRRGNTTRLTGYRLGLEGARVGDDMHALADALLLCCRTNGLCETDGEDHVGRAILGALNAGIEAAEGGGEK